MFGAFRFDDVLCSSITLVSPRIIEEYDNTRSGAQQNLLWHSGLRTRPFRRAHGVQWQLIVCAVDRAQGPCPFDVRSAIE
jgi:hypothetical protein